MSSGMLKAKVFVSSRHVGWLRAISPGGKKTEYVVVCKPANATKFTCDVIGIAMANFEGPEAPTFKAAAPAVTFQLVKV